MLKKKWVAMVALVGLLVAAPVALAASDRGIVAAAGLLDAPPGLFAAEGVAEPAVQALGAAAQVVGLSSSPEASADSLHPGSVATNPSEAAAAARSAASLPSSDNGSEHWMGVGNVVGGIAEFRFRPFLASLGPDRAVELRVTLPGDAERLDLADHPYERLDLHVAYGRPAGAGFAFELRAVG